MNLDLEKAHKAMQSFTTAEGEKKLEQLAATLATLKKSIPVDLNDTEFNYVLKSLIGQRSLSSIVKPTKGGFVILSSVPKAASFGR
jgi:hypothetical protein